MISVNNQLKPIADYFRDKPQKFDVNDADLKHKALRHFEIIKHDFDRFKDNQNRDEIIENIIIQTQIAMKKKIDQPLSKLEQNLLMKQKLE